MNPIDAEYGSDGEEESKIRSRIRKCLLGFEVGGEAKSTYVQPADGDGDGDGDAEAGWSGGGVSSSLPLEIDVREGREGRGSKGREGKGTEAYQFCSVAGTTIY